MMHPKFKVVYSCYRENCDNTLTEYFEATDEHVKTSNVFCLRCAAKNPAWAEGRAVAGPPMCVDIIRM